MPAMHDEVLVSMLKRLSAKRELMVNLIPFDMSHEECIHLVAPSEHIPILTSAAKYADIRASESWMYLQVPAVVDGEGSPTVALIMRTHAQKEPPLRPRTPEWQPGAAGEKVIEWLTKRFEIGRRFGTASYVLTELNRNCDTGAQLRYMLPVVMHLCQPNVSPRMDKWAEKFATYKPCRFTPAVSPELKTAIQDTAALLTSSALIGEDVPERLPGEVDIGVNLLPPFKIAGKMWSRE